MSYLVLAEEECGAEEGGLQNQKSTFRWNHGTSSGWALLGSLVCRSAAAADKMYQQQKLANVERRTWDKAKYEALAKEKVASGEAAAAEGDTYAKQERVKVRRAVAAVSSRLS